MSKVTKISDRQIVGLKAKMERGERQNNVLLAVLDKRLALIEQQADKEGAQTTQDMIASLRRLMK